MLERKSDRMNRIDRMKKLWEPMKTNRRKRRTQSEGTGRIMGGRVRKTLSK